jgi:hypothetical protein
VVASLALMAAPSWAAKGGNSANAKLCEPGGYPGLLFNQNGEAFKNAGACTKYAAKGGKLVGLDAVGTTPEGAEGAFTETCSGFGLHAGFASFCQVDYEHGSIEKGSLTEPDGTWSLSVPQGCEAAGLGRALNMKVFAETEHGSSVVGSFPLPSGCALTGA